jgi:UDP-perosamine 4-acetyltransferase
MQIVIIGAGGHGKVVADIIRASSEWDPVCFVDANPALVGKTILRLPVVGQANLLPKIRSQGVVAAVIAIGDNRARATYARMAAQLGFQLPAIVHPSAIVSPTATLGANVVVAAGVVVGVEASVTDHAILNTGCVVDHECRIGEAAHIGPAAALAGRVSVGSGAFVGLGSRVIQCLSIGRDATVGAGAVVTRDVPDGVTVIGVPARIVNQSAPRAAA